MARKSKNKPTEESEAPKEKPMLFQFLDDINFNKVGIMDDTNEKEYVPFVINHFLSGTVDTILYANEMNLKPHLDKKMQCDYLRCSIRKKRRFAPWLKKTSYYDMEKIEMVMKYFKYSFDKAKDALKILSEDQLARMKKRMEIGG